ncbi:MAG: diacylglycerol/lipid kinase family protein [Terracidiphilus sp.]
MRRVALIYNPQSGQYSAQRDKSLQRALALLREAGIEAEALETDAPGSAKTLAKAAMRNRFDTILACGGDGTVHEVLQCLVGTDVALGVVPLGTANALAQDLGLGTSPVKAVRKLLSATPTQVPVGRIFYHDKNGAENSCYFTVAAGIGADALLMASLDAGLKRRFGYALYMVEATRIWATNPFPLFSAAFSLNGSGETHKADISQLLAVRVRSFGGALGMLAPGATLRNDTLKLITFNTRNRFHYLRFLLAVVAGRHTFSKHVELVEATAVACHALNGSKTPIYVEADGEVLGALPARMEVASQKLTLLIPPGAKP